MSEVKGVTHKRRKYGWTSSCTNHLKCRWVIFCLTDQVLVHDESSSILDAQFVDIGGSSSVVSKHTLVHGHLIAQIGEAFGAVCIWISIFDERVNLEHYFQTL